MSAPFTAREECPTLLAGAAGGARHARGTAMKTRWMLMLVVLGSAALSAPLGAQWKPDEQKHCDACIGYYTSNPRIHSESLDRLKEFRDKIGAHSDSNANIKL